VAYQRNLSINQNNVVNISGSNITLTGSLTGSEFSGSRLQSTTVSASVVSASTYVGLPEFSVTQQLVLRCINQSGASIAKGKVVHITSSLNNSDTPHIVLASWDSDLSSANTLGMTMETIANNATGSVILTGMLTQVPLIGTYTDGQMIYLSSSGDVTPTKPTAPLHEVRIGQVTRTINSSNNTIFVRVQNGYELDELHDTLITSKQGGDLLVYNSGSAVWNNSKTLNGNYSITSASIADLFSTRLTASDAFISGDIRINGTASIGQLNTVNQTSLIVGDRYITILSGAVDHAGINGAGFLWGTSSGPGETTGALGEHAHILYEAVSDALEIFPGLKVTGDTTLSSISGTTAQFISLTGALNGNATTATTATNIAFTSENITGIRYLAFSAQTSGNGAVRVDSDLTYNPGTNTLTVSNLTASSAISGSNIFSTRVTGSFISGSQITGSMSGSHLGSISGALGQFTTVSGTTAEFSGNVLIYGTASLTANPTSAYVLYSSSLDRVVIFPGLFVSGSLTASNAISSSIINVGILSASNARLTGTLNGTASVVANSITFSSISAGSASPGSTFNGSAPLTVSYSTIGAVDLLSVQTISGVKTFSGNNIFTGSQQIFNTTITGSGTVRMTTISGTVGISGSNIIGNTITGSTISASTYVNLPPAVAAGTAGQIQFNTGSNVLGADSTFVWDNTNKRLAVGKSAANTTLDILGNTIISGNLTVTGSITELSTRRIKTNITSLNDELTTISKLNPVSYTRLDDGRREYGFISEEVKEVYPEFVVGEGINYPKMVSILVSAVKELTEKIENQSVEIELLKNKKKTTRGKK
jgi:hypothetical protein